MTQIPVSPPVAPPAPGRWPTKWPTVLGIILLILSIMAAVQGVFTMLFQLVLPPMHAGFEEMAEGTPGLEPTLAQIRIMREYIPETLVVSLLGTIVACLLIRGSAGLLKRRPWSPRWCVAWAIAKIMYACLGAWYAFSMMRDQFAAMGEAQARSTQPGPPASMFEMMSSMGMAIAVFQLLFLWAMPVFLLVWFRRATIREEIATWTA